MCQDYRLKISDFGISQDIYESLHHHAGRGPLLIRWMALESILDRQFTTMSDMYEKVVHGVLYCIHMHAYTSVLYTGVGGRLVLSCGKY